VRDLRQTDGLCYPLAGGPAVSVLERRIEALERSFDRRSQAPVEDSEERRRIIEELEARRPEFEERMAREEAEGDFRRRRALEDLEESMKRRIRARKDGF
jgi:molecular chaperone GrpE (heat shock protein)